MPVAVLVRTLAVALIAAMALAGCAQRIDGRPTMGPRDVDQSYFFAGDIATYGQILGADETITLAYLRAMRRIDVCGLLSRDTLAKVGEIAAFGTMFAFNECDLDVKVSGTSARKFVAVELLMSRPPVTQPDPCEWLSPLDLTRLPGAPRLHQPEQPFVQVEMLAEQDCTAVRRISDALADRLSTVPLPPRDGVAAYPAWLAEQDPCEVLSVLGDRVENWQVDGVQPYQCRFGVDGSPLRLTIAPQLVEYATEGRDRREQGGVEVYVDPVSCSAVSFVGPRMQRKLAGAGYVDLYDLEIRPAVSVDSTERDCETVADVTSKAAALYG